MYALRALIVLVVMISVVAITGNSASDNKPILRNRIIAKVVTPTYQSKPLSSVKQHSTTVQAAVKSHTTTHRPIPLQKVTAFKSVSPTSVASPVVTVHTMHPAISSLVTVKRLPKVASPVRKDSVKPAFDTTVQPSTSSKPDAKPIAPVVVAEVPTPALEPTTPPVPVPAPEPPAPPPAAAVAVADVSTPTPVEGATESSPKTPVTALQAPEPATPTPEPAPVIQEQPLTPEETEAPPDDAAPAPPAAVVAPVTPPVPTPMSAPVPVHKKPGIKTIIVSDNEDTIPDDGK